MRSEQFHSGGHVASIEQAVFWVTVLFAGATFWISPHPPMADLPQHAGQIALWHNLLLGTSKWQSLFYVNYFTPYLVGNGLALLLSFIMPVAASLKLLLALSYYAFVSACVLSRRWMGGDRRLDWLFVTGFFGLAYAYGFFPFLIAVPVGMLFIALAYRYAQRPVPALGVVLCFTGLALFFSHGLVFLFANVIGVTLLLLKRRSLRLLSVSAIPYGALGLMYLAYFLLRLRDAGNAFAEQVNPQWPGLFSGLKHLLFFPIGVPSVDWVYAPLVPLLLCAPLMLGCRVNWRNKAVFVPISILILWLAFMPDSLMETFFIGSRFAVFLLPFYAFLFSAAAPAPNPVPTAWAGFSLVGLAVPALCWVFLAIHAERSMAFARESKSFDEVLAAAEPGYRAKGLVVDIASASTRNLLAYVNFPLWYQVEKSGLVDFNFSAFATGVVRYQNGKIPADGYRYFFVRSTRPLPEKFFAGEACEPVLRKYSGSWSVFENVSC